MKAEGKVAEILDGVQNYAHRGVWDKYLPENSLAAICLAADKGLGLEIDVHLTSDNKVVVFHDHGLRRMCGVKGIVEEHTSDELRTMKLRGTDHTIPTFEEVLKGVGGRVPILVELKCKDNETALCDALIDILSSYKGPFMFIGFNEKAAAYLKSKGYTVALSCYCPKTPSIDFKPDVLLCNISGVPRYGKLYKYPPFISWTVVNNRQRKKSEKCCIATIFNTKHFDF